MSLTLGASILIGIALVVMFAIGAFTSSRYVYRDRWSWSLYRRHLVLWGTPTAAAIVLIAFLGD